MRQGVGVVVALLTVCTTGALADLPVPVSPGGQGRIAVVPGRCPTFNWAAEDSAVSLELVIYRLPESEGPPEQVLRVTLPGSATGWTPSAEQCLEPGSKYAWSVGVGGDWSEASLFEVTALPSVREVEEAMDVLRRYEASAGGAYRRLDEREKKQEGAESERTPMSPLRSASVGATGEQRPRSVTSPGSYDLYIGGDFNLGGFVFKDGYPFLHNDGGLISGNTAVGLDALVSALPGVLPYYGSGRFNTAIGAAALKENTYGASNSALGQRALIANTTGKENTALGVDTLRYNTSGVGNTAIGAFALSGSTASGNRTHNTAIGSNALGANNGNRNIAVGVLAGSANTSGSDNIFIGHWGLSPGTASNTLRIGYRTGTDSWELKRTFIAGIRNAAIATDLQKVCVDSADQLGPCDLSTERLKEQVQDLDDASSRLLELRPVTFRYKPEVREGHHIEHFGLIAEEVARVFPTLVSTDGNGKPFTVRYDLLTPLLLNELQKQHRQNRVQWFLIAVSMLAALVMAARWRFG